MCFDLFTFHYSEELLGQALTESELSEAAVLFVYNALKEIIYQGVLVNLSCMVLITKNVKLSKTVSDADTYSVD